MPFQQKDRPLGWLLSQLTLRDLLIICVRWRNKISEKVVGLAFLERKCFQLGVNPWALTTRRSTSFDVQSAGPGTQWWVGRWSSCHVTGAQSSHLHSLCLLSSSVTIVSFSGWSFAGYFWLNLLLLQTKRTYGVSLHKVESWHRQSLPGWRPHVTTPLYAYFFICKIEIDARGTSLLQFFRGLNILCKNP